MSIRRCSPYAHRQARARPSARLAALALVTLLAALAGPGCTSAAERRQALRDTEEAWRQEIPEDSQEESLEHIRELRDEDGLEALASVPLMLQLALGSPSALVRAEALRTAWVHTAPLPVEAPQPAALAIDAFQTASAELEALLDDPYTGDDQRAAELAALLCSQRFPPEQLNLAVLLAELATSRARWSAHEATAAAFAEGGPGVVRHATSLVTLRAAEDRADIVREEAFRAIPHLHPQLGLVLAADALDRELDGQRLLVLLDGIEAHAEWLADEDWEPLLNLVADVDLGVARRVEELRAGRP